LLALLLVAVLSNRLRIVFAIAAIPGVLSVLALSLVREPKRSIPKPAEAASAVSFSLKGLDPRLVLFLVAGLIFALGNSSDVFLILRAKNLGLSTVAVVLAYVLYNFVYMGASLPAGIVSDRAGRRNVFVGGLLIFALVYAGFALARGGLILWLLFAIYGLYIAFTDGVSKAFISDLAPKERRATILGTYGTVTGVAALVASVAAGLLWDHVNVAAPFALGAVAALLAAILMLVALPRGQTAAA